MTGHSFRRDQLSYYIHMYHISGHLHRPDHIGSGPTKMAGLYVRRSLALYASRDLSPRKSSKHVAKAVVEEAVVIVVIMWVACGSVFRSMNST